MSGCQARLSDFACDALLPPHSGLQAILLLLPFTPQAASLSINFKSDNTAFSNTKGQTSLREWTIIVAGTHVALNVDGQ